MMIDTRDRLGLLVYDALEPFIYLSGDRDDATTAIMTALQGELEQLRSAAESVVNDTATLLSYYPHPQSVYASNARHSIQKLAEAIGSLPPDEPTAE